MQVYRIYLATLILFILVLAACKAPQEDSANRQEAPDPVQVTHVVTRAFSDVRELNATSMYRKEHLINSPVSGYITQANCVQGTIARAGDHLFEIKTREARALSQSSNDLVTSLNMNGATDIKMNVAGYIAQVFHQEGDYVAEGENLVSIKETGSLVFVLDLPFEWNKDIKMNMAVVLTLPDNRTIPGTITTISPMVDPTSQTQKVFIKVVSPVIIPENLVAKVSLPLLTRAHAQVLPRRAVLSNETETEFWIMKLMNDSTAVKIPVTPGIQTRDSIEVLSPLFPASDEILVSGNYAVPDTARVQVIRE